jgi:hypothetical protein
MNNFDKIKKRHNRCSHAPQNDDGISVSAWTAYIAAHADRGQLIEMHKELLKEFGKSCQFQHKTEQELFTRIKLAEQLNDKLIRTIDGINGTLPPVSSPIPPMPPVKPPKRTVSEDVKLMQVFEDWLNAFQLEDEDEDDFVEFNLNHNVQVKLTETGLNELECQHNELWNSGVFNKVHKEFIPPATDKDGWTHFQLWVLMENFGDIIHNGCNVPFETTIRIKK